MQYNSSNPFFWGGGVWVIMEFYWQKETICVHYDEIKVFEDYTQLNGKP